MLVWAVLIMQNYYLEVAEVLFKYFPFFCHTFKHVSLLPPQLILIEVSEVN